MSNIEEDIASLKSEISNLKTQITSKQEFLSNYVRSKFPATEEDLFRNDLYFQRLDNQLTALNNQLDNQQKLQLALLQPQQGNLMEPQGIDKRNTPDISSTMSSKEAISLEPKNLYNWLNKSPCSSNSELHKQPCSSMAEVDIHHSQFAAIQKMKDEREFPLTGREVSLAHMADCFRATHSNRFSPDRNLRKIPIIVGPPGIGKTTMLTSFDDALEQTDISGDIRSVIITFGTDEGAAYGVIDTELGIESSLAWRVLHAFFKYDHNFLLWMQRSAPSNSRSLSLEHVVALIEYSWLKTTPQQKNLIVFIGIDEYQKLPEQEMQAILSVLCGCASRKGMESNRVTFLSMLAGTDLEMHYIARSSCPYTSRTPISYLTYEESITMIQSFISKTHPEFCTSELCAQSVYFIGGVPRILVEFAKSVQKLSPSDAANSSVIASIRKQCLSTILNVPAKKLIHLAAHSLANYEVDDLSESPEHLSSWTSMSSSSLCIINEDKLIRLPYYIISNIVNIDNTTQLTTNELAFFESLRALHGISTTLPTGAEPWLNWEIFGAHFHCIRINALLVIGLTRVSLSRLFSGTRMIDDKREIILKPASIVIAAEPLSPNISEVITIVPSQRVSWLNNEEKILVVKNAANGKAVDLFFALKLKDSEGHAIILDQRKMLASDLSKKQVKVLKTAAFAVAPKNLTKIFVLMSACSSIETHGLSESTVIVSVSESLKYHGSLFENPGCCPSICVNSACKTAIGQLLTGSSEEKKKTIDRILKKRLCELLTEETFMQIVGALDENAAKRIRY